MMTAIMMMKGAIKRRSDGCFVAVKRQGISLERYFNNRVGKVEKPRKRSRNRVGSNRLNVAATYFRLSVKTDWERRGSRVCNQVLTLLKTSLGIKSWSRLVVEMPP